VNLTAGQQINSNQMLLASNVTASTTGTLATPWSFGAALVAVTCTGCSAGLTAIGTQNSTAITFTTAQTITAASNPLTVQQVNNFNGDSNTGYALDRTMAGGGITMFDYDGIEEDPNDPGFYLPGYSFDGVHAHELGHAAAAKVITPVLQQMIGQ
jgi:hypothetical protein